LTQTGNLHKFLSASEGSESNKTKQYIHYRAVSSMHCVALTYQHILQGNFSKPAVEKYWDKQIPQRFIEYLTDKHSK